MKHLQNMKYILFICILAVTGFVYYEREGILEGIHRLFLTENGCPGEDITISGGDAVSDGDAVSGGDAVSDGDAVSGGDAGEAEQEKEHWRYQSVEKAYFDDAVFIGDSRTVGLYDYAGLDNTTFYASTGLTVYKIFSSPIVSEPGSKEKITIEEALSRHQFKKIYLMIGINEMGTGTVETFMNKYREVVEHIRELQPDAIIYLQGIMKVTTDRSNQGDYINNPGIEARNTEIAKLADDKTIFYLDVNPLVCDETGGLIKDYTFDGVHLKAAYIDIWKQFLMDHAIEFY